MTAIPEPSDGMKPLWGLTTAELVYRASALSEHGRELLIGTLAGDTDPRVRLAFIAALGGAEAGQGLTGAPRPAETQPEPPRCICVVFSDTAGYRIGDLNCPVHGVGGTEPLDGPWPWAAWKQHKTGEWTVEFGGTEDQAREFQARAAKAFGGRYLVLPEGQRPDEAVSQ